MDRQKKPLHHNKTGRECRGDVSRLAGLPQLAAEILEEYFTGQVSKSQATPRHIIIKMTRLKDKERILKAAREKQVVTYKRAPIGLSSDFSTEIFQCRRY